MVRTLIAITAVVPLFLTGCAATIGPMRAPSEAIRYHGNTPIERGTASIVPASSANLENPAFTAAIASELTGLGFTVTPDDPNSEYVVGFESIRAGKGSITKRPPVSIGIGGGGYSDGVGLGAGITAPVGKSATALVIETQLTVTIRRRSDNQLLWEGHARTTGTSSTGETSAEVVAPKLAHAMFKGFPGESGITITVK